MALLSERVEIVKVSLFGPVKMTVKNLSPPQLEKGVLAGRLLSFPLCKQCWCLFALGPKGGLNGSAEKVRHTYACVRFHVFVFYECVRFCFVYTAPRASTRSLSRVKGGRTSKQVFLLDFPAGVHPIVSGLRVLLLYTS